MRELALHILDIFENSVRAGATEINITVELDQAEEWLHIRMEDNGKGLSVTSEQALDPFYTTKAGKRTGLGLSLFKAAAEQASGAFDLGKSPAGGVSIKASFDYHNVDRMPLGNLAATFLATLLSNPELHLVCSFIGPNGAYSIQSRDKDQTMSEYAAAKDFAESAREAQAAVGITD